MQRVPFESTRYAGLFESREGAERFARRHRRWARRAGRRFARRLSRRGFAGGRLLEVGSGGGQTALALAEALPAARIDGLDTSESLVSIARGAAKAAGLAGRVRFVVGDAQAMPFADGAFDAIVSHDTLHCVPEPAAMLGECERVLRPGGTLLVRNIRRSWLGAALEGVFRTAYTAGEVRAVASAAALRPWRLSTGLFYLELEASPRAAGR